MPATAAAAFEGSSVVGCAQQCAGKPAASSSFVALIRQSRRYDDGQHGKQHGNDEKSAGATATAAAPRTPGTARAAQVRPSRLELGSRQVRASHAGSGQITAGQARPGQVRPGQAEVGSGLVGSGARGQQCSVNTAVGAVVAGVQQLTALPHPSGTDARPSSTPLRAAAPRKRTFHADCIPCTLGHSLQVLLCRKKHGYAYE